MPEKKRVTQAEMYEVVQELSATSKELIGTTANLAEQAEKQRLVLWGDPATGHKGEIPLMREKMEQVFRNKTAITKIKGMIIGVGVMLAALLGITIKTGQ